jgi:opacity protein-like surface antigen
VNRLFTAAMLAGLAISVPASNASAQAINPFEIGGAVGAAVPTGDLGDIADMGYNATFMVGYNPVFLPVGLRFDAAYNEFGRSDVDDAKINIPSFTANAIFKLPTGGFTPYVIGGAGLYRPGGAVPGQDGTQNRFGWNAGGGISMPLSGFKVFVEARFNNVSGDDDAGITDYSFIPVTFGLVF